MCVYEIALPHFERANSRSTKFSILKRIITGEMNCL